MDNDEARAHGPNLVDLPSNLVDLPSHKLVDLLTKLVDLPSLSKPSL